MANCTPPPKFTLPLPCLGFLPDDDRACWPEEGSGEAELEARCSRLWPGDDVGTGERGGSGATGLTNLGGGGAGLAAAFLGVGVVAAGGAATTLGAGEMAMGDGC